MRNNVEVTAKIAKSAASLMVEDAKFWVVRPRISLSGVSGLSTLLSGNYIGFEAGASKTKARQFTGLEVPPIITGGSPGRQYVLQASDLGSLGIGSPVYYRRLAGRPGRRLRPRARRQVGACSASSSMRPTTNTSPRDTRFWNASGIDVSLTANGLDVRTQSLAALLEGGIAFETPPEPELDRAGRGRDRVHAAISDRVDAR